MTESKEELKSFLMKMKEENEKTGLNINIQRTKIMASSPISSWQLDGEKMKTVIDFIFFGSKITVDGDCSHEIKRCLFLGSKVMRHLDSVLKSRDTTLSTVVHLVKAMAFPVVMYGCESWTMKKAECQKTDAFELSCWRRLLKVPWITKRSNQSILEEINPEYSLEGLMQKLKRQHFGHLIWRADSLEKTLMLGQTEGRRGQQRMTWLDGITDSVDMSFSKLQEILEDREPWCAAVHEVTKSLTQLRDSRITTRQSSYLLVPTCFPGTLCSEQWPHVWLGALSLWSEELDFDDRAKGSSPYLLLEAGWRRFI